MKKYILAILLLATTAQATTYYVKENGNDLLDGLSWGNAWATIAQVNSGASGSDTTFFATGTYRDTYLWTKSGTLDAPTIYACSAFALTNGDGTPYFAVLKNGDSLTGWSVYSGNVYSHNWTTGPGSGGLVSVLFQEDSLLWQQTSLGAVNAPGKWYYSGNTVYAYVHDFGSGFDPDSYEMNMSTNRIVELDDSVSANSYVHLFGFRMKYAFTRMVEITYDYHNGRWDGNKIEHCWLSHCAGWEGINPGLYYSGTTWSTSQFGRGLEIRACSLGFCWSLSNTAFDETGNKGSGIDFYTEKEVTVDSCTFYGHFTYAAYYQKAGFITDQSDSAVLSYNTFTNTNGFHVSLYGDGVGAQVYGNTFYHTDGWGGTIASFRFRGSFETNQGATRIYNNTFYGCEGIVAYNFDGSDGEDYTAVNNQFKWNVMYSEVGQFQQITSYGSGSEWSVFDNNIYYNSSGTLDLYYNAVSQSWSQWQVIGMDAASTNATDPGFTDAANGDFSRLGAEGEMPDTTYGGQTWDRYGAIQGGAAAGSRVLPSSIKINGDVRIVQ